MIGWVGRTWRRVRLLARRRERERAMDEEMRFHIDMEAADLGRAGIAPAEARRRAYVAFGGVERFKEAAREARGTRLAEDLWQDVGYAVRQLAANPGFASATVLTLALGIGTTKMMYSVRRSYQETPGVTLRNPERLVYLGQGPAGCLGCATMAPANYLTIRGQTRTLEHVSMIADWEPVVRGDDVAELMDAARVTAEFFQTFDVQPILGRTLDAADAADERGQVVVLSEVTWKNRFAADPGVLGRSVVLDRVPYTIVGVVPNEAAYWPRGTGMWVPLVSTPERTNDRTNDDFRVFGRLREGVEPEAAALEIAGIGRQLEAAFPEALRATTFVAAPLLALELNRLQADPAALIFRAAVGLVLLIACINLAGLLVARLSARRRELAVRRALGASSARVARQLVAETVLITGMAAIGGVLFAAWGTRALLGGTLPLDGKTLGVALAMGLITGLLIALWPSLRFAGPPVVDELRQSTRAATGGVHLARGRRALVMAQIALTIVVLAAAGALARSFENIYRIDAGFRGDQVVALRLRNALTGSDEDDDASRVDRLVTSLASVPGVEASAAVLGLPFGHGAGTEPFEIEGRAASDPSERPTAYMQAATPAYLELLGIPVLRGRAFRDSDGAQAPPVAIVNRAFVERFLPDQDPLGRALLIDGARWEIVGVVGDVFHGNVEEVARPEVYRPLQQWPQSTVWVALRTGHTPAKLAPALLGAIRRFDPDIAVTRQTTIAELRSADMGSELRVLQLMSAFALAAIAISAIGLYGLISYSVTQRVREFGVRLALGAHRGAVLRLVLGQGIRLAAVGAAIGLVAAAGGLRLMRSMLYAVSPLDPLTLGGVVIVICLVAVLAAYVPARRAMLIDPVRSLGEE